MTNLRSLLLLVDAIPPQLSRYTGVLGGSYKQVDCKDIDIFTAQHAGTEPLI